MKNLEILYEDENSLVINKPAGLAVQGGEGVKNSLDKLIKPALLVHRLDKDTSGVILAAKGREAAARFSQIFGAESRKAVKTYTAVCSASKNSSLLEKKEGVIRDDLKIRGTVKKSETKYKVIKTGVIEPEPPPSARTVGSLRGTDTEVEDRGSPLAGSPPDVAYAVLELELGTGRMHQIRRHLAMNGNPILGDDKYGDFALNKKLKKEAGLKHLLLHASRLIIKSFNIDVYAPLPEYFHKYT